MSGKPGMKSYPQGVKEEAVRMFYEEGYTKKEIADKLGIKDKDRVKKWLQIYRREGISALVGIKGRPRKQLEQTSKEDQLRYLEMENKLLRNFLCEVGRR